MTQIDIVAVTYESSGFVDAWASSVRALDGVETRVIVVDNASRDGTPERVAAALPGVTVLRNPSNEGFGRAANRGIGAGDAPYVLLCNVDLELAPDSAGRLAAVLDGDPGCGSACPKLVLGGGIIDSTGLEAFETRMFADRGHGEHDDGRYDEPCEVFGASGAAVLYRRTMLEAIRVGGAIFDPDYFLYWEDIDLAWRARLAGWRARYEPAAVGTHRRGSATGRAPKAIGAYAFAHRLFTIDKNDDPRVAPRRRISAATAVLAAGLARKPDQWGVARSLLGRRKAVALKRREVQALRTVPSTEIESWFAPMSLGAFALERLRAR